MSRISSQKQLLSGKGATSLPHPELVSLPYRRNQLHIPGMAVGMCLLKVDHTTFSSLPSSSGLAWPGLAWVNKAGSFWSFWGHVQRFNQTKYLERPKEGFCPGATNTPSARNTTAVSAAEILKHAAAVGWENNQVVATNFSAARTSAHKSIYNFRWGWCDGSLSKWACCQPDDPVKFTGPTW